MLRSQDAPTPRNRARVFPPDSDYGALYVKIICAKGVPKVDVAGWAEPYFLIRLPDESGVHKEVFRTPAKKCRDDRSSVWYGVEYTGMKIKIRDAVKGPFLPDRDVVVELWDKDRITKDTRIGTWKMPISELCKEEHGGAIAKTFRMDGAWGDGWVACDACGRAAASAPLVRPLPQASATRSSSPSTAATGTRRSSGRHTCPNTPPRTSRAGPRARSSSRPSSPGWGTTEGSRRHLSGQRAGSDVHLTRLLFSAALK